MTSKWRRGIIFRWTQVRRLDLRPPCTQTWPAACKVRPVCNVFHVSCKIITWGVSWQNDGIVTCPRIKNCKTNRFRSNLCVAIPRLSATAHSVSSCITSDLSFIINIFSFDSLFKMLMNNTLLLPKHQWGLLLRLEKFLGSVLLSLAIVVVKSSDSLEIQHKY